MFLRERYRAITLGNIARSDTKINFKTGYFSGSGAMSFEDELKQLISDAQNEAERRKTGISDFRNRWQEVRQTIVQPALQKGAKALEIYSVRFSAMTELHNGSISLKVGPKGSKDVVTNQLTFSPIDEKLQIQASYRNSEPETFTLDKLDQQSVENKIKEFFTAILND
jgi:hypothetical protein